METYSIRRIDNFNIDANGIEIYKNEIEQSTNIVSSRISPFNPADNVRINNDIYNTYKCEYYTHKNKQIRANDTNYTNYDEVTSFNVYHCPENGFIFTDTNSEISPKFFKYISKDINLNSEVQSIHFDFNRLIGFDDVHVSQIWFRTHTANVDSKYFVGHDVNANTEAFAALRDGHATYIVVSIDITSNNATLARKIGISQRSAINIISNSDPTIQSIQQKLTLLSDTYDRII